MLTPLLVECATVSTNLRPRFYPSTASSMMVLNNRAPADKRAPTDKTVTEGRFIVKAKTRLLRYPIVVLLFAMLLATLSGATCAAGLCPAAALEATLEAPSDKLGTEVLWPVTGTAVITSAFDMADQPWLPGHRGIDLQVNLGDKVRAPGTGTVIYAGMLVDRPVVSIENTSGMRFTLEPVDPIVRVGDEVVVGAEVGRVGAYTTQTSTHDPGVLHWGTKVGSKGYVDPLSLLYEYPQLKQW